MALVARVRISYEDAKGKSSASKINIPISVSVLAWLGFALQAGQIALNVSTCRITKIGVYTGIDISGIGIKANPSLVSDVEEKAFFLFNAVEPGFSHKMLLPAFSENFVIDGTDEIDTSDPLVAAFVDAVVDGFITTPVEASNVRAMDIIEHQDAWVVFRKRRGSR